VQFLLEDGLGLDVLKLGLDDVMARSCAEAVASTTGLCGVEGVVFELVAVAAPGVSSDDCGFNEAVVVGRML